MALPPGPVPPGLRQRLEERQALHELVRISHSRVEDLRLLHSVWQQQQQLRDGIALDAPVAMQPQVSPAAVARMLEECGLREEWRVQREQALLSSLRSFEFATCGDEQAQKLADQLLAVQQVQEAEQRAHEKMRSTKKAEGRPCMSSARKTLSMYTRSPAQAKTSRPTTAFLGGPRSASATVISRPNIPALLSSKGKGAGSTPSSGSASRERPGTAPVRRQQKEMSRPHMLLHMQRNLRIGLRDFKKSEGTESAHVALQGNVSEGQSHFLQCMEDVKACVRDRSVSPTKRAVAWHKEVWTGKMGLTKDDFLAAERLSRQRAARIIQRIVRLRFLPAARRRREASRLKRAQRDHAALRMQTAFRGHLARRDAARLRAAHHLEMKLARVEKVRRATAAQRIQQAWRRWIWGSRVQGAANRAALAEAEQRRAEAILWREELKQRVEDSSRSVAGWTPNESAAAIEVQKWARRHAARRLAGRRRQAVVTLQAAIRGWLVRRGVGLWWKQALRDVRRRRARARRWQEHRRDALATHQLEAELLKVWMAATTEVNRAADAINRETKEFERSWARHVKHIEASALKMPLPRNWVPQMDPVTTRPSFLNTRTGEVHSRHPNLHSVWPQLNQQRLAAEQQLQQRLEQLRSYAVGVRAASASQQAEVYSQLRLAWDISGSFSRTGPRQS